MFRFLSKFFKKMGQVGGFYFQNTMLIGAADQDPVLCLGQDFWGTPMSPYLNFRGTFANSGGHTKSVLIFTCKIEKSFSEISVHFYLNLSSMLIVLAQEGVQITLKLFLHCRSLNSPANILFLY